MVEFSLDVSHFWRQSGTGVSCPLLIYTVGKSIFSTNDGRISLRLVSFWRQTRADVSSSAPYKYTYHWSLCRSVTRTVGKPIKFQRQYDGWSFLSTCLIFGTTFERMSHRPFPSTISFCLILALRTLLISTVGKAFQFQPQWRSSFPSKYNAKVKQMSLRRLPFTCLIWRQGRVGVSLRSLLIPTVGKTIKLQHQWRSSFPSKYLILAPKSSGCLSARSLYLIFTVGKAINSTTNDGEFPFYVSHFGAKVERYIWVQFQRVKKM